MAIRTPRSADHRFARWKLRFATGSDSLCPAMGRLMTDPDQVVPNTTQVAFDELVEMEGEVRTVLNAAGVSVITYPFYLAYARELWKLIGRISGESARVEAAVLLGKWEARDLAVETLEAVRNVFNLGPPTA